MRLLKTISWQEPLDIVSSLKNEQENWIMLYSGLKNDFTGTRSILVMKPQRQITSSDFSELEKALSSDKSEIENAWLGYLGYGLKNSLEKLTQDEGFFINMPDMWMINFGLLLIFDHKKKRIDIWGQSEEMLNYVPAPSKTAILNHTIVNTASNMTKDEYLKKVDYIKDVIYRGDLYQANLTRKFYGEIKNAQPVDIFTELCKVSPAPYSAILKLDNRFIISSSPERFVHVSAEGDVDTRPIKGSAPRFDDAEKDRESKKKLQMSEKDRAENLMIVDLSRNDISRHCEEGSVKVEGLFEVTSYATVHHMASTVKGIKKQGCSTTDLIKGCFPPGSMTGAPKIKAMQLCSELEKVRRGVYSGAIGIFGGDGSADLSVVIRTIIIEDNKFEFQVGGAIVADSCAEKEFEESILKAKAMSRVLGINIEKLKVI
ncbi:MAG: anthranilate synthase component I family protein [Rickettsiales bacterium]|nr:anthranilate synthase component I family protein [Pseudomonadota bacterium]MDA0965756.1 anthranilate synthase component I family protein [Pseudomonadota bacterium]MDG4543782.1 anthranilate synthase component I family protein [Rickettsiales bacterium]MDG4545929.1 anthranilate synthase component I family protein [Rickettsiales bacterium]MDG4548175.1 anthranilate synthase component I family protein [Rickettsiales bacterium]